MNRNLLFYLFISIVICGCNNQNKPKAIKINGFPVEKEIHTQQIYLSEDILISYPAKIIEHDSIIYILDIGKTTEFFVHCYSLSDYRYIQSLFKRGQGPNEFIFINNIQIHNDTLYAYSSTNEIFFINTTKSDSDSLINKVKLSDNFGFLNRGVFLKNSFFFPVFTKFNKNRILEFNVNGDFISTFGHLVTNQNNIKASTYQAYMPFLHGNNDILVAASQFGEILEIYKLNNKEQINLLGTKGYPEFQETNDNIAINKGIIGYEDIYVTNNYIYALFNGESESEKDRQGGKYVYVYTHEGKPLIKLILDRYAIGFYIDENKKKIYLLDANTDNPLFYATLPEIYSIDKI